MTIFSEHKKSINRKKLERLKQLDKDYADAKFKLQCERSRGRLIQFKNELLYLKSTAKKSDLNFSAPLTKDKVAMSRINFICKADSDNLKNINLEGNFVSLEIRKLFWEKASIIAPTIVENPVGTLMYMFKDESIGFDRLISVCDELIERLESMANE